MVSNNENNDTHLTEEILSTWKKSDLVKWLVDRKKKKSGNKFVLVKRILRTVHFDETSDSECESSGNESQVPNIESLQTTWSLLTTCDCPPIRSEDVENYFVYNKNPLTGKKQGCHRQLKKARRFAKEQYLHNIELNSMNDSSYCCIRAICKPSMRQTVSVGEGKVAHNYSVSVVLVKRTGKIEEGRCNCKAGKSGLCSHVGGLLFTIVDVKNACTSRPCEWKKPTTSNKLTPQRLENIQFSLNENTPYKPYPDTAYRAGPCRDPDIFFKEIMQTLGDVAPQSVLYQTLNPEICDLKPLMTKYSPSFCFHDSIDISSSVCQSEFRDFTNSIHLSDKDIVQIQESTRGQSSNPVWKEMRTNILTASNFGAVCKKRHDTEPDNLISKLRGYSNHIDTKAMTYGRKKEGTARRDYMKNHLRQCGKVTVETAGLVISKTFPFLGASADGIVKCDTCGTGVLEIKCPFICRNEKPEHYATTKSSCVDKDENGNLRLKAQHNYMYQVQGQMRVLDVDWCDFVVWTKKGLHVERISYDSKFWEEGMITQLKDFYSSCFIAERFTERVRRGKKLFL